MIHKHCALKSWKPLQAKNVNRRRTSRVLSEIEEDTENESIPMKKIDSDAKEPCDRGKVF